MGKQPAAVIGVGQTHHRAKREDVSMAGLLREAIDRALEDAQHDVRRHRRDRRRQGAGPVRGRDDARAVPGRLARRRRQAAAACAHRRLGRRLDRDRRLLARPGRRAQEGAHGRLREAVGVQRDVGALGADPVQHAGARRRGRLLRAARALLHPSLRGADPHRRDRGRQGPSERAEEPLRPPEEPGHHRRVGAGLADAVGPDPVRRDLPVLRRRLRAGDRRRGRGRAARPTRPGSTAP